MLKRWLLRAALGLLFTGTAAAQSVSRDFFDNLLYTSYDGRYRATLKRDVFNGLSFSDNHGNRIEFDERYLARFYPDLRKNDFSEERFLRQLVRLCARERNYSATHKIDVFDRVLVEDNRGNRREEGTDIFGNPLYQEQYGGERLSLRKNLMGDWEYRAADLSADLKKSFGDAYTYSDSRGNRIEFGRRSWQRLVEREGDERRAVLYLIEMYARQRQPFR